MKEHCRVTTRICFWGEGALRLWKRPVLFVLSGVLSAGFALLAVLASGPQDMGETTAVWAGVLIGILGMSVAAFACDRCVSRVLGNV